MTFDLPAVHLKRDFNSFELEGVNARKQVPLGEIDPLQAMEGCTRRKLTPTSPTPTTTTTKTTTLNSSHYHHNLPCFLLDPGAHRLQRRPAKGEAAVSHSHSDIVQQRLTGVTGTYGRTRRSRGAAWSEQTSRTLQRSIIILHSLQ